MKIAFFLVRNDWITYHYCFFGMANTDLLSTFIYFRIQLRQNSTFVTDNKRLVRKKMQLLLVKLLGIHPCRLCGARKTVIWTWPHCLKGQCYMCLQSNENSGIILQKFCFKWLFFLFFFQSPCVYGTWDISQTLHFKYLIIKSNHEFLKKLPDFQKFEAHWALCLLIFN